MRKATLTGREVRFRASTVDERRLAKLAKHYEMTESAVMRRLIADGARAAGLDGGRRSSTKGK
jgi:hypothetical protein